MLSADALLKPISNEKPCGEDLAYDPSFQELDTLIQGKPETQWSPAEEPDWKTLRERCLALWQRAMDLRLINILAVVALKTEGLTAFPECLALLKGVLEKYWDQVHPQLDPADHHDPLQRVNIIAALSTPVGSYGDPLRILERLGEAPLTESTQMGRLTLADILRSEAGTSGAEQTPPPSAAQIAAAFHDTTPEHLLALHRSTTDSLSLIQGIDELLVKTIGADKAPSLEALAGVLQTINQRLIPYLPEGSAVVATEPSTAKATAGAGVGTASTASAGAMSRSISGDIQSRQDVVRLLDKICDYYAQTEPASPVPYMLRRAQRLAGMDFMQIINDLSPDALNQIKVITGHQEEDHKTD